MAVYIWEPDAFDKIVQVEGPEYPENQKDFGPCSFQAFLNKWNRIQRRWPEIASFKPEFGIEVRVTKNANNSAIYGLYE